MYFFLRFHFLFLLTLALNLVSPMWAYTSGFVRALWALLIAITADSFLIPKAVLWGTKRVIGPLGLLSHHTQFLHLLLTVYKISIWIFLGLNYSVGLITDWSLLVVFVAVVDTLCVLKADCSLVIHSNLRVNYRNVVFVIARYFKATWFRCRWRGLFLWRIPVSTRNLRLR